MSDIVLRQSVAWMPADVQTPISLYLGLVGDNPGILLESAEVDGRLGRFSLIAWDFKMRIRCEKGKLDLSVTDSRLNGLTEHNGEDFLPGLRKVMSRLNIEQMTDEELPAITRSLCGFFGYGMAGLFERKLASVLPPDKAQCTLVLPGSMVLFDHLYHRCCHICLDGSKMPAIDHSRIYARMERPVLGKIQSYPQKEEYEDMVSKTKEMIRQGECIQTVVSTRFSAPFSGDPLVIYRRLRQVNPSPYMFYMRFPRITLLGSSPELLVRCNAGELTTAPIAGTRVRGANEAEDAALAQDLLNDPKERAEHVMLVDLGRNDLGRIAKAGSVVLDKFMQIEKFSHVMHITSYVKALLKDGLDALDVLASAFPAGTVSGAPKVRAMEIIGELESIDRGPYAGAIGWIGLDKDKVNLDTGITIRSLWVRDGMLSWQAGAGIVYDSVPEKEWAECNNKARVLAQVLAAKEGGDVFTY